MAQKSNSQNIIIIQDPERRRLYAIDLTKIADLIMTPDKLFSINGSTVTFVIPSEELTDVTPPFVRVPASEPSVLLQDPSNRTSYFLTFQDLEKFKVRRKFKYGQYRASFVMPTGLEFIAELPYRTRELLQSGESGATTGNRGPLSS